MKGRTLDLAFLATRRLLLLLAAFGLVTSLAPEANAALKKYDAKLSYRLQYFNTSPKAEFRSVDNKIVALVDDSGASPVLRRLTTATDSDSTTIVPELSGFIWFSQKAASGPADGQTGTGSTASSINWGNLSGWTVSGGTYCHSIPSFVCNLAAAIDFDTVPSPSLSSNYDYGTWVFHGTGFTHPGGWITRTSTNAQGNQVNFNRGVENPDGTVPAIPLLGIAAVGLSVFVMGAAAFRRQKK